MRVLALDTTTRAGSVALVEDDRVVDERSGDAAHARGAAARPDHGDRRRRTGVPSVGCRSLRVASGPGSFTGLRIGIATIQGLAFVHGRRMVAVPALDALAHLASLDVPPGTLVAAWMDAHRRDVFSAVVRVTGAPPFSAERLVHVEGPTVGDPASTVARWVAQLDRLPTVFIGDGAVMYAADVVSAVTTARVIPPPLLAGAIGRLTIARQSEAVEPGSLRPLYVRRPDAEIARDEKLR